MQLKKIRAFEFDKLESFELKETGWLFPSGISAFAKLGYDENNLYCLMETKEENIRAEYFRELDPICEDSCLEFFFAPNHDSEKYFNFEWNYNGALYLGFGGARATRVRQIVKNPKELFDPMPYKTVDGWGIKFKIPFSFIRMYFPDFSTDTVLYCNFYKCGDKTIQPHYLAWAPLSCDRPDFHRRGDFGEVCFSGETA